MKKENTSRPKVRMKWSLKPYERIKESDRIYSRSGERDRAHRDEEEEAETRIAGLDVGEKRIGVALSDPLGMTAQPAGVIQYSEALPKLRELAVLHHVTLFVVGHPIHLRGEAGEKAASVEEFSRRLSEETGLPCVLVDERLSSKAAERALREMGVKPSRRKEAVDQIAALLILQSYLDRTGRDDPGGEEKDG